MSIPGYHVPVHHSLIRPILLAGVPRGVAILNGTLAAAVTLGLHNPWILPFNIIFHVIAVILTQRDADLLQIFARHMRLKTYYRV